MKLAFSTNAFTQYSLHDALQAIAACGYVGAEILADAPHVYPPVFTDDQADDLALLLNRLPLSVSNVNANCTAGYFSDAPPEPFFEPSLISPRPQYRADRLAMIRRTLEIAARINAPAVSITSGKLLPTVPPDHAAGLLRQNLEIVLQWAHELRVSIGIECEPGLFIEWAAELRSLIDDMQSPLLGANLDIGHSIVAGESIPETLDLLAGRIWNIHLEDIAASPSGKPKHYHLIPGQGEVDFAALRRELLRIGYAGFITVELYTYPQNPAQAARQSMEFLRDIFPDSTAT